jgi:hypothetical protein
MATQQSLPGFSVHTGGVPKERMIYPHPSAQAAFDCDNRFAAYNQMWAYYTNTAFEDVAAWFKYVDKYALYTHTRGIFNPVQRIVDFYVENIYPGVILEDGVTLKDVQNAIPIDPRTDKKLRDAIYTLWEWSNWQDLQGVYVLNGAVTGNSFVEVVEEPGKVLFQPHWSGHIQEVNTDTVGNVTGYHLKYDVVDRLKKETYCYEKIVTPETIEIWVDGALVDERVNTYPFVPAVWVKHVNIGSDWGVPAIKTGLPAIDELNSIVSHTADHIHKQINSPRIMWTDSVIKPALGGGNNEITKSDYDSRKDLILLKGAANGSTDTLVGNLDPATIVPLVEKIYQEIERIYPEIMFYEKLRDQSIVTSVGAKSLMGDVSKKVSRPATSYDRGTVRLCAMAVAIAGERISSGDWNLVSPLTQKQKTFDDFGFDSYNREELNVKLLPRDLVPTTSKEQADELEVRTRAVAQVADVLSQKEKLKLLGYRDDQIEEIIADTEKEVQANMDRQIEQIKATEAAKPKPKVSE